jgi:hypothetical protein
VVTPARENVTARLGIAVDVQPPHGAPPRDRFPEHP